MTTPRTALQRVIVVVPAHDEAERIGACLTSVARAVATLGRQRPDLDAGVVLVLDRCTDATADVATSLPASGPLDLTLVEVDAGSVGAARGAGVARVAADARLRGCDPAQVLVVNTDADCVVPAAWLVEHVALARDHDLVQGEVDPDPAGLSPRARRTWAARHPAGRGSLHGANLGFRLDAYLAAGGFPAVAEQEDLLLVRAMKALGVAATGGTRVLTSSRRDGRTPGGFAAYLRGLDLELDPGLEPELEPGLAPGPA